MMKEEACHFDTVICRDIMEGDGKKQKDVAIFFVPRIESSKKTTVDVFYIFRTTQVAGAR